MPERDKMKQQNRRSRGRRGSSRGKPSPSSSPKRSTALDKLCELLKKPSGKQPGSGSKALASAKETGQKKAVRPKPQPAAKPFLRWIDTDEQAAEARQPGEVRIDARCVDHDDRSIEEMNAFFKANFPLDFIDPEDSRLMQFRKERKGQAVPISLQSMPAWELIRMGFSVRAVLERRGKRESGSRRRKRSDSGRVVLRIIPHQPEEARKVG